MVEDTNQTAAYEYAVMFTEESGELALAYNEAAPRNRAAADTWCRVRRTWQEDRHIEKDATLMRRLPGQEWEGDPKWAAEIRAWNEHCARIEALLEAGDKEGAAAARDNLHEWVEARVEELIAGEAR